jgi:hypothetical protein
MDVPPAIAALAPDGRLTPVQWRRFVIDFCLRRIRPGTGSTPEFLRRRTAMNPWPDLRPILQGIPWVIVGGVATRAYMPERATKDLDILTRRQDGDEVRKRLGAAGYRYISPLAVPGFLARSAQEVDIDVILGDYPWLDEALAHPQQDPAGYPALALPYLVLMKMAASRVQDTADVSRMLGLASEEELVQVREVVACYAPQETDDLESLIYLGQVEAGRASGTEGGTAAAD